MNDRHDPYGQIYGYDEYGRPRYHRPPEQPGYGYGYDPYSPQPPTEQQPFDAFGRGAPFADEGYSPQPYPPGGYPPDPYAQGPPQPGGYGGYPSQDHHASQGPYSGAHDPYGQDPYGAVGYGAHQPGGYGTQPPGIAPYGTQDSGTPGRDYPWGGAPGYDTGPQPADFPGAQAPSESYGYPTEAVPPGGGWHGGPGSPPGEGSYDPYGTGPQTAVPGHEGYQSSLGSQYAVRDAAGWDGPAEPVGDDRAAPAAAVPAPREPVEDGAEYRTEQFSFVEEDDTESEEVIDWLKFTESRTERREDAKRRASGRRKLLSVLLVLSVIAATGYLYVSDRLPFLPGSGEEESGAEAAESRDVIILHLRETGGDTASTALLVTNEATGEATTLLIPNELMISPDGGTTTLGQGVTDEGAASVRNAVGALLGADIKGTWRLDTPYLENLVDLVGGITVEADTEVPGEDDDEPLVTEGEQRMDGRTAVAYAVHRSDDESQDVQLERFGSVFAAALGEVPETEDGAVQLVENLAQIADPSLSENDLGVSLSQLAGMAQDGAHTTTLLPVEEDGSVTDAVAEDVVADVLGGTVTEADTEGTPQVALRDGSDSDSAGETARIGLINGGYTVIDQQETDPVDASEVRYEAEPFAETAREVARTLGISEDSVVEGSTPGSADVAVVIGPDLTE